MEITQIDISNLLKILGNQNSAINNLSKRLIEAEILLSSITDVVVDNGVITKEELLEMMNKKIDIVNINLDVITKLNNEIEKENSIIDSFPYFGKPGQA